MKTISKNEILDAQKNWGETIVKIGEISSSKTNFKKLESTTIDLLKDLYNFEAPILFKPTKVSKNQFRNNLEATCSYFIGNNLDYEEDKGFALEPWKAVDFENSQIKFFDSNALAMGNYYFTDQKNVKTKVEYTFGYQKINNQIKIFLHHSSLPYTI